MRCLVQYPWVRAVQGRRRAPRWVITSHAGSQQHNMLPLMRMEKGVGLRTSQLLLGHQSAHPYTAEVFKGGEKLSIQQCFLSVMVLLDWTVEHEAQWKGWISRGEGGALRALSDWAQTEAVTSSVLNLMLFATICYIHDTFSASLCWIISYSRPHDRSELQCCFSAQAA